MKNRNKIFAFMEVHEEYDQDYEVEDDLIGVFTTLDRAKLAAEDHYAKMLNPTRVLTFEDGPSKKVTVNLTTTRTLFVNGVEKVRVDKDIVGVIVQKCMNLASL